MFNFQTTDAGGDLALGIMVGVIFVPIFLGLAFGIMLPLMGGMIRYRADYQPRGALCSEMSRHASAATSFFGSLSRVKALEGWYGLYKGSYPLLGMMAISSPFIVLLAVFNGQAKGPTQTATLISAIIFTLISIALLPLQVIYIRCIVTPYRLSSCANLGQKLQLILSPAEFNSPMRLYATPGLLPLTIVASVFAFILTWAARSLILGPAVANGNNGDLPMRITIFLVFRLVATLWLTPLDVLAIRLSLLPAHQEEGATRLDKGTNDNAAEGEVTTLLDAGAARCSSLATEDVVRLRYGAPYTGTIDCVRRVSDEEGVRALYRGWIWTCLGSVLGVMG